MAQKKERQNKVDVVYDYIETVGVELKKKFGNKIMNIHIQDPKVSLNNFDFVIAPEHDDLKGENVLSTKGAIHYLRESELDENLSYLKPNIQKEKVEPSTLTAFVREQINNGNDVPMDLFGVYVANKTKIKGEK